MDFFTFDDEYVRRLRAGDRATSDHYYEYFNFFLGRKLKGRVAAQDEKDVIQAVHLRVFLFLGSGKKLRNSNRFGAFVFRICDNVLHERSREHVTEELFDVYPADFDQLRDIETAEVKARIHRALAKMKEHDREILQVYFFEDFEKDEVAEQLGVTRAYLRVLVFRALAKFRPLYDDS
ncbi:MAG TPA: sigma-70 family RNA polymerase sigma factor [Thermoanaerobaculia bacterium]